jgi:ribosome-associated translation inhibitor RaiA
LGRYLKTRLREQLAFCGERIRQVEAHFSDINGRRGGADKRCRLVVRLSRAPEVVVESTETDLYLAIRRAADRMSRALQRRIGRQARRRRTHRPGPAHTAPSAVAADEKYLDSTGDDQ